MENNNKHIFDKQLNDRLSSEDLSFDPVAWEKMEEKLDEQPRGFIFWNSKLPYFLGLVGLFIIATIYYWPHHYSNTSKNAADSSISAIEIESEDQTLVPDLIAAEESQQIVDDPATNYEMQTTQLPKTVIANTRSTEKADVQLNIEDPIDESNNKSATSSSDNSPSTVSELKPFGNVESGRILSNSSTTSKRPISGFKVTGLSESETSTFYGTKKNAFPLDGLIPLFTDASRLYYDRSIIDLDLQLIEIEEDIIRPRSQLNFTVGGGMTKLETSEGGQDTLSPVSVINHEAFVSLSYLHRIGHHWGVEAGLRGSYQTKKLAYYFEPGTFNIQEPVFAKVNATNLEGKYELFTNVHFFLPLSQRSELDLYAGYYSMNPFESQGTSGSGSKSRLPENEDINILAADFRRETGPFKFARLNVGLNYNFLTNKRNTVGIGISYMHQLNGSVTGDYSMFQTSDFTAASGKLRENGSGFKVQFTYGFGMGDNLSQGLFKKKRIADTRPWYLGMRYGQKLYLFSDQLSKDLISGNPNQYGTFFLGHYISQKLAFEVGLEYYEFNFSTPTELVIDPTSFGMRKQSVLSVPFAIRHDLIQTGRFIFYGKGVFSTDFRLNQYSAFSNNNRGAITDKSRLRLNGGLEAGIDCRLFEGVHFGVQAKYNKAFSRLAQYQYPVTFRENEYEFQNINLNNNYFSWGVELKYVFGR